MKEDMRARLLANSDLTARVAGRIDWGLRPAAGQLPAITLTQVSGAPDYTYKGRLKWQSARIQMDVWAATYGTAELAARLLPAAVEPSLTQGGTDFGASFLTLDLDGGTEEAAAGVIVHRRIMEFTVWHRPAAT